eukprot:GDKH01006186.1.p1 GENE.GDKH01006186.1~~GDKH01006186.1.p1  ORF type:complete len:113 (-),score=24.46 GDKH01006186.1:220-558(-)
MDNPNAVENGDVYDVPMSAINRPLPPVLDEAKVEAMMSSLKEGKSLPAINVLHVEGKSGQDYYFGFGGCHRFEAHKRLGRPTVLGTVTEVSRGVLKHHLGASTPQDLLPEEA